MDFSNGVSFAEFLHALVGVQVKVSARKRVLM